MDLLPNIVVQGNLCNPMFDAVLIIGEYGIHVDIACPEISNAIKVYCEIDHSKEIKLILCNHASGKRILYAPTGMVNGDYDDVRNFQNAAVECMKRALSAGCKAPLVVLPHHSKFKNAEKTTLLGILHALFTPIEVREHKGNPSYKKIKTLGVYAHAATFVKFEKLVFEVKALEIGRTIARDIGGSDPERMSAPKVVDYLQEMLKDTSVSMSVISDPEVFEKHYPLLSAVNRCAANVPRHAGQVVKLEYIGEGTIKKTLMLVGKGITYDTGGANIKIGGSMAGMHRDKCGAASVAGFFKTLSVLKPKNLKVIGALCMVRNSVGSDCYVSDEIIHSRAGVRVRVRNSDAEGRMVMTDVLCEMKERALNEVNPYLFTIATLTGHVVKCYGENYASCVENGPARMGKISECISIAGEEIGDPCEVTKLRKEDFEFTAPFSEYEDVLQGNNIASTTTDRGHMIPVSFMVVASGLDKHGCDSDHPLPYTHIDIAGSSGPFPGIPTGSPLLALSEAFIFTKD